MMTSQLILYCLPTHAATDIIATTTHPNPHTMSMLTQLPIPPLDCTRRHGQTKIPTKSEIPHTISMPTLLPILPLDCSRCRGRTQIPTKIEINITMAHTLWLARPRSDDPLPGQPSPLPPQSFLSKTP